MKITEAIACQINRWSWDDVTIMTVFITIFTLFSFIYMVALSDHSIKSYYMYSNHNDTGIYYAVYGERHYCEDTRAFISTNHTETIEILHILQETLK